MLDFIKQTFRRLSPEPFSDAHLRAPLPLRNRLVVTGAKASGKTTFAQTVSQIPTIGCDVFSSAPHLRDPAVGDVFVDYGEIRVDEDRVLEIYTTPGQRRFDFMWTVLCKRAIGAVVLVDNSRPDPVGDLLMYVENIAPLLPDGPRSMVAGVRGLGAPGRPSLSMFQERMPKELARFPIVSCDPRDPLDALFLIQIVAASASS